MTRRDRDPKALACYGLVVPGWDDAGKRDERMLLRVVEGRPVSTVTTQFLAWCCDRLAAEGKGAMLLVWDNASWHLSKEGGAWIREHPQRLINWFLLPNKYTFAYVLRVYQTGT